jgi:signal transduction histidine kinase
LLAGTIAFLLTRSITGPVRELERGMRAVADGDFDHKLKVSPNRGDEFGRLSASFDEMSQQLAALDKLKAEFVSIASHELKTPINVVLGYLQLLNEGIYGSVSPKQREVHRTLEAQVQSLSRLVTQLLDVSRFEAGGGRIEVRSTSLPRFLDELERGFQVLAIQRDIRFLSRRGDGLPNEVEWDVDSMSEVLGNLLSNAFKFTERGGEVELGAHAADDWVELEVRDTGAGIPPEHLPHIFEKFFQADNQRGANAKGSGLGLAIAKGIVEAHGGSIRCESTPGVGTTFTVVMPVHAKTRRVAPVLAITAGAA